MQISITKSYRLTSKHANKGKIELVYSLFDEVKRIRNEISLFCFENVEKLIESSTYKLSSNYKKWKSNLLPAHAVQTLMLDVINFYKNHVKQLVQNVAGKIRIQEKLVKETYKKGKKKGQIKSIDIKFKKTILTKFITYLIKASKIEEVTEEKVEKLFKENDKFRMLFKNWWESKDQIAHNRGIRVHLSHSGYSSQQCLECGYIDKSNRPSQSVFRCSECGFEEEADKKSAITLLLRLLYEPYRKALHVVNEYGELRPKKMSLKSLKYLLIKHFEPEKVSRVLGSFPSSGFFPSECSLMKHSEHL